MKTTEVFIKQGDNKKVITPEALPFSYRGKDTTLKGVFDLLSLEDSKLVKQLESQQRQIDSLRNRIKTLEDFRIVQMEVNKQMYAMIKKNKDSIDSDLI